MVNVNFFSRLIFIFILLVVWLISGCSAKLTERGFLAQSDTTTKITVNQTEKWQREFPYHQLSKVSLNTNGAQLNGLYLDNADSNELIFFIQGNGMQLTKGGLSVAKTLSALNKDIIIFDHRGVGASSGQATIENLASDAKAQLAFIQQQYTPEKLIVHGFSLGSFIAARISKNSNISALILQGSATNVDDWIDARTPWYSKPFFTIDVDEAFQQVDNLVVVKEQYNGPLLVIAGEDDQMAPAELSTKLFNASQSPNKQLLMVEGADHSNMLASKTSMEKLRSFLSSI